MQIKAFLLNPFLQKEWAKEARNHLPAQTKNWGISMAKHSDAAMDKKLIKKEISSYAKKDKKEDKAMVKKMVKGSKK